MLLQVVFSNLYCITCQCWQFENGGRARFVKCKAKKEKGELNLVFAQS